MLLTRSSRVDKPPSPSVISIASTSSLSLASSFESIRTVGRAEYTESSLSGVSAMWSSMSSQYAALASVEFSQHAPSPLAAPACKASDESSFRSLQERELSHLLWLPAWSQAGYWWLLRRIQLPLFCS